MAILDDSDRIETGKEMKQIIGDLGNVISRINQYKTRLTAMRLRMETAPFTAADRAEIDNLIARVDSTLA